jgi:signal transduction histidine kinase
MTPQLPRADLVFTGDGDMARLCRELDWSATALGPVERWPDALRTIVRTALESRFAINLWCGADLVLIYNDAYRRVLGAKHPGALGRPGTEIWSEIWDEIEPMFARIRDTGESFYSEDAPFVVQRESQRVADQPAEPNAWFTFSLSAVRDAEGEIVAFLNIVSETTARIRAERALHGALESAERAEARIREVFAQAPAFMALLRGDQHVFEYANEAYYQLVGHRDLIGRPVLDALPEIRGQGFESLLDSVVASGTPFVGREVPVTLHRESGADPEQRYLDFVYYPIHDPDGQTGVVAHGYDITEHVLAREEARRARSEAELANHAKSQFLATMSHEIRTPINAVVGYTDLLEANVGGPLSEAQKGYVSRIRTSSRHLLSLVNDVLDLSRIEAGEMLLVTSAVQPQPLLNEALEMILPHAEARSITVRRDWACDDCAFLGDADRVRQVLLNLLSNAVKFTQEGGTITLRCGERNDPPAEAALAGGPWLALEVEDDGPGVPPEAQSRIFEAFVQADSGLTRAVGGTGLGLTISRRLARLMNGELTLHSEPGAGSRFSLWLPVAGQPAQDESAVQESDADPAGALRIAGGAVLADGNTIERQLVSRLRVELPTRTRDLDDAHLADHTASYLAALARSLMALDDPAATDLLADGRATRADLSRRHGSQRRRLGWGKSDLELEYALLEEIVSGHIRSAVRTRAGLDLAPTLQAAHELMREGLRHGLAALRDAADDPPTAT